jgi:hypothetical protein
LWRGAGLLLAPLGALLLLYVYPRPLFAHEVQRGNLTLHARAPLPPQGEALLARVLERLQRSPLYDASRIEHAYLCDSPLLYRLLTFGSRGGGVTNPWGTVFIRSGNVATDEVLDLEGRPKGGERTLTYYLAHEFTHALSFAHYGFWHTRELSAFQREGYADYVGFGRPLALRELRVAMLQNAAELDPKRSGLYLRYELLVAYLLEQRRFSVDGLFANALPQADVEHEFLSDDSL